MVAVIDGAVKDSLSAIICCTIPVSLSFNSVGVNANIASLQSVLVESSQVPALARSINLSGQSEQSSTIPFP